MSLTTTLREKITLTAQALLSPRSTRREGSKERDDPALTVVKVRDVTVVNETPADHMEQRVFMHLEVVRVDGNLLARFFSDSDRTFHFGSICLEKCRISLSSKDLRTVHVTRDGCDDITKGLSLRVESAQDAADLVGALSGC